MKKIIAFFNIIILSLFSVSTISCSNLNIIIKELNNNISDLLFKDVKLSFNISNIINGQTIMYWQNFNNNINNFLGNIYIPNTTEIKKEYQQFFKNLGYKNVSSNSNLLRYLKIEPDQKQGIGNIGFIFSGLTINQNNSGQDINFMLHKIRMYFVFSDPINGVYKQYYFSDSDNISKNFKNAELYFPVPKNNLNNETYNEWIQNKNTKEFIEEKSQLLYLKLWFDWILKPNQIQNLLVSKTPMLNIMEIYGLKLSNYNIFNLLTTNLFGETKIISINLERNNKILDNLQNQSLEINDILIVNINFNFLDYNKNFLINISILR